VDPSNRGQVAIEAALVMPLALFLVLGILQSTVLEQAKLMTEYAAFQAARAGIVWSGNNERMRDAAMLALLPTMAHRTDSAPEVVQALAAAQASDMTMQALPWGTKSADINGASLTGLVRVDTVNPAHFPAIDTIWNLGGGSQWQELEFDGPESYPQDPALAQHFARFFDLKIPDSSQDAYRQATLLSIRLRYLYEMRIPFANWVVFLAWYAGNAGLTLVGPIERPAVPALAGAGRGISNQKGLDTLTPWEMDVLWHLADSERRYFLPLTATYSLRMQSNFHRKWLMHDAPSWNP
jgi:hypothetical protein